MEKPENSSYSDKISYLELIQLVVAKKKILVYTLLVFLLGGILVVLTSPVEYVSSATTISESEEGDIAGLNRLGGLAGMAGINLPTASSSTFSPGMYPDVISSRSFLLSLIDEEFFFETKGQEMSLKEYYLEERPGNIISKTLRFIFGLPTKILNLFSPGKPGASSDLPIEKPTEKDFLRTTSADEYVIGQLRKRINIDNENRLMTLNVKGPEPLISAQLNSIVLNRLIAYVTEYKTDKQRINLEFVEERTKEAEQKFKDAQLALALFRDSNQGIVTQKARTREEFLQAEFNIAFNVYNTLKQDEEQARIQLKKETPVFTTFEPAVVPLGNAEPNTPFILIIAIFLGLFIGMGLIILLIIIEFFKKSFEKA
jgi:uncharacterized protein involved in exopolysaccharide biosynthesis